MFSIFFLFITQIGNLVSNENQSYKDIVPLKTNRATVEQAFKRISTDDCSICKYSFQEGQIEVRYSTDKCGKTSKGWDLPKDTVLEFTVIPNEKPYFKKLLANRINLISFGTDDLTTYYLDKQEGVQYVVDPYGYLTKFVYFPSKNFQLLRCKGFPKYDFIRSNYLPFKEASINSIDDLKTQVEQNWFNFGMEDKSKISYLIFYKNKDFSTTKYRKMLNELRNFAYKQIKIPVERFRIIEGGKRQYTESELFIFPSFYPKPLPTPEFPS